jgi:cell division protein FtsA
MHEKFIAAVDLGTSTITVMLAKKDASGHLAIIAAESVDSDGCIRRGRIYNTEKTAEKVARLIGKINAGQTRKINKVYVGIGGQSLRATEHTIVRKLSPDTLINQKLLDNIKDECRSYEPRSAEELLDVSSPEYFLDELSEPNPLGVQCSEIKVKYRLIIGKPFVEQIKRTIEEKAHIPVAACPIAPEALAEVVLSPKEKEAGCALIDFGAGKTTVAIYKNHLLKHLVAIPLGAGLITKDICSLGISRQEAEELKVQYGAAIADNDDDSPEIRTAVNITPIRLNSVIEARVDEILINVAEQIKRANVAGGFASVVITGGGAALRRLPEAVESKTGCRVRVASVREELFATGAPIDKQPRHAQVIGLLAQGNDDCIEAEKPQETIFLEEEMNPEPVNKPAPAQKRKKGFIDKLKDKVSDMAGDLFQEQDSLETK